MKVLITGSQGYVAGFVAAALAPEHALVGLARQPVPGRLPYPQVAGDLRVLDDCRRAVAGVDAIVHLGGVPVPAPDTFETNVIGTYNLLEAAREHGVRRVVLASSMCAVGVCFRPSGRPFEVERLPIDESHPPRIEDGYGLSKLTAEHILAAYARAYGIEGHALRLCWCWGPAEHAQRRAAPWDAAAHQAAFWAYVDMRDAAEAFRLALGASPRGWPPFGAYFITAADTFADEPSSALLERFYPQYQHWADCLPGHASFFSWQAARQALGYEPRYSWRDGA